MAAQQYTHPSAEQCWAWEERSDGVGEPDPVGCLGGEPSLDQVAMSGRVGPVPLPLAVTDAVRPGPAAEPCHLLVPEPQARAHVPLCMDSGRAVGTAGVGMNLGDELRQSLVLTFPISRLALDRFAIGQRSALEHPAGHRGGEPIDGQLLDRPDLCFGRMSFRAK